MNVLVYGAGAIGQFLGAKLALAGAHIHLIARAPVVTAIAAHGLRVTDLGARECIAPGITASETLIAAKPDLVLLTVKGAATAAAARDLVAHLPAGTPVLSFQNGVEAVGRLHAAAPNLVALAGMVSYNVVQTEPGRVRRATQGWAMAQRAAITERLLVIAMRSSLRLQLRDDMPAVQWGKLLLNLNNPVNALSGLPLRQQLLDPGYRDLLADLQVEALRALHSAGIRPARVSPLPAAWLPTILRLPTAVFRVVAAGLLRIAPEARSSMLDDRLAGRITEVDDLCGAVIRVALRSGAAAPLNAALCGLMNRLATDQYLTSEQLRAALRR